MDGSGPSLGPPPTSSGSYDHALGERDWFPGLWQDPTWSALMGRAGSIPGQWASRASPPLPECTWGSRHPCTLVAAELLLLQGPTCGL